METKVTVVVPILNSIQYIEECIDSIVRQTLREIEILLIDAGSTDGTLEKLYEYEAKDCRCKVLHSDMKSCGYQNNLGVSNASGEYIAFVESDDVIELNMLEELWEEAKKNDLDFIKGEFEAFYNLNCGEKVTECRLAMPREFYNVIIDASNMPRLISWDFYLWKGLYKRFFLLENEIWQNTTKGAAFQDVGFLMKTISQAKRVMYTDKTYYKYRRDNSGSSVYNINGYVYLKNEFLYIEEFINSKPELEKIWPYYYLRLYYMLITRDRVRIFSGVEWNEVEKSLLEIAEIFKRGIKAGYIKENLFGQNGIFEIKMLCKNLDLYLENVKFKYELLEEEWNNTIDYCQKYKNIVIFGCSIVNKRLFSILERNHINVTAFCDNMEAKWGQKCCGVPVISPKNAVDEIEDVAFLIPLKYEQVMREQLIKLGVDREQIIPNDIGGDLSIAFVYQYNKR